ncbi:MAG: c-type cytochrome, partial [Geminicoccaceae bacterium]
FRTITTGFSGTPMPSYMDSLPEEDRWALAYYILSLSAFTNPLTGEPLQISEADRAALNDPSFQAPTSALAYTPGSTGATADTRFAGGAWANRHGMEVEPEAAPSRSVTRPGEE